MKLEIENIGKIKNANVEIGGLTIIAGQNNTGKSTIGKVLFAMIKGINLNKKDFFNKIEKLNLPKMKDNDIQEIDIECDFNLKQDVKNCLFAEFKNNLLKKENDNAKIDLIFDKKRNDIYYPDDKNLKFNVSFTKNKDIFITESFHCPYDDITFIDSPYTLLSIPDIINDCKTLLEYDAKKELDLKLINKKNYYIQLHQKDLINKLTFKNKSQNIKKTANLINNINKIIDGNWEYKEIEEEFYFTNKNGSFTPWETASGIKSFGIIQLLLDNGDLILDKDKPLIIDEPEVHLHPEWHIKYAEILVELVKNDIPVIITTHSNMFLQSLIALIQKNDLKEKTHFYLATNEIEGSVIKEVEKVSDITKHLLDPMYKIINGE
ncbi:MAG: AAA family ATPase [Rickettsiales bacterium]|nr:MAG: AAA family ATPase [Rickettsiales bacterium]